MRYTENVYKRKRNRKVIYDGVFRYYDEDGNRVTKHCERKTRTAALDAMRDLRAKLEEGGPRAVAKAKTTFAELAQYCETEIYKQAEYNDAGEKLEGVRQTTVYQAHIKHLKAFFRNKRLDDISVADIKRYRSSRLSSKRTKLVYVQGEDEPQRTEANISPSTVARELNTLRAMLNEAIRNKWGITENPFKLARPNEIFRKSDQKKRNLFLTFAQERTLLAVCESNTPQVKPDDRRRLRALLLTAVDTGARYGELIGLEKSKLDWTADNGRGRINGLINYKGQGGDKSERFASMTPRVRAALLDIVNNPPMTRLRKSADPEADSKLVFGGVRRISRVWKNALKDAGLAHLGFHFHDLRHTPGTRVKEILALPIIQKALGHKDPKITASIYINDEEADPLKLSQAVESVLEQAAAGFLEQELLAQQETLAKQQEQDNTPVDQLSKLVS